MHAPAQRDRAERFQRLHQPGTPLLLANAWDGVSARLLCRSGFAAIGTTSAGLAWSLGYPDGQRVPPDLLVDAVARIARCVDVPLTVDLERGYGPTPGEVCGLVRRLVALGAVGVNIEDGSDAPERLAATIAAVRCLARELDLPLFVNARTDVYLRGLVPEAQRLAETIRRLGVYVEAGADGVFVPGIAEPAEICAVVEAVPRPLNVYAGRGVPPVAALARLGVARVSVGCGPLQAALGLVGRIAGELQAQGTWSTMTEGALSNAELNALLAG